ncbi:MAG: response regulator [Desulfobacteraceae bacterium]|nr:response regulator [Desulfobacteraceae bacterium]
MRQKHLKTNTKTRNVHIWDHMVLIGIALALFYTVFESILYIFLSYDVDFFQRLFGPDMSAIWTRIAILCLFLIFGSHAQFTINQRSAAEAALRESEEKFRNIIETAPDGYYEVDMDGNFTFFNDSMCKILGYSRDELATMNQSKSMDEINASNLTNIFNKVLETRLPTKSVDWVLTNKDGSKRFVESSVSLISDPKGEPIGFGVFVRDATQRQRAEALYREKLAAEAASQSKSEFLASMSHEIRTPLNAIIGLVELMLSSDLPPDQREDLDVVKSSAYSLLSIINNILDFSKIEAGKLVFEQSPFRLRQFMDESMKIMGIKSHEKGIELAYRIVPGVPDHLSGDAARLRQVLLNLIDNAIKFTDEGEVIVYVAAHSQTDDDVILHISVVDTGIGIPLDKQRAIFSAYNQADVTTSGRYGGTGLGLAVSAQLVNLMGGTIKIKSQPGHGSRFRFTARFVRQHGHEARQEEAFHPELNGLRVLVVDDNRSSRKILKEILEIHKMDLVQAAGAKETMDILLKSQAKGTPFNLILLDSDMPEMDGFALAGAIKQQKISDAGIIMMLTFPHFKRKAELEELGITIGVLKPVGPLELVSVILDFLGIAKPTPVIEDKTPQPVIRVSARSLKILVAEDTPFNQRYILRLLERWNHQTTLVENGRQALEAFKRETFDIVLMDVQMPEMDGLESTRKIREWEDGRRKAEGGRRNEEELEDRGQNANSAFHIPHSAFKRIPIVAMTAHVIKGDRERCLEAGMNEYVSKPIDSDKLFETIEKLTRVSEIMKPAPAEPVIADSSSLLKVFDEDWDFLKEVVEVFIDDYPRVFDNLQQSFEEGDCDTFMRSAHSLKGMLKNFKAETAAEIAFDLEKKGKTADLQDVQADIDRLAAHISEVDKTLRNMIKEQYS